MTPTKIDEEVLIEKEIAILATLHPSYTKEQLRECRDNFVHYIDFVWKIYLKMRADGRAKEIFDRDSL